MIGQFQFKKNRRGALNRTPELNLGKSDSTFHADIIKSIPSTLQTGTHPVELHDSWGHQNTFAIQILSTTSNNEFGKFISQQQEIFRAHSCFDYQTSTQGLITTAHRHE